ncbi:hypothetical protein CN918_25835 [Priestia megaterium]|nr:hypothetical protein CN918_25835 [Priestia megaterium]
MRTYTLETLMNGNNDYHNEHNISEKDIQLANEWVQFIEQTRDEATPQPGDIVQYTSKSGIYFHNAHFEYVKDGKGIIIGSSHTPLVSKSSDGSKLEINDTGGGNFFSVPTTLRYIGKRPKMFWFWGHKGICGGGGIDIEAMVNVWEYQEGNAVYTTRDYERYDLYVLHKEDESQPTLYKVISESYDTHIFNTYDEYEQWVRLNRGIEMPGEKITALKTIWTHKQVRHDVSEETYNILYLAKTESVFLNGNWYECKRIYENATIHTYVPPLIDKYLLNNK